jgi:hypothetical protein
VESHAHSARDCKAELDECQDYADATDGDDGVGCRLGRGCAKIC